MELTDNQAQQLAEAVENVIQSRNFANELRTYDEYMYEEMVNDALEQNDVPQDINPQDIEHELTLKTSMNSEAWAQQLGNEDIQSADELNKNIDDEDELVQALLNHLDNFDAQVEIKEEIDEVRNRKPTKESLKEEIEESFDVHEFGEYLRENENEVLNEAIKERAIEEGFPQDVDVKQIDYTIDDITLTQSFEAMAENYLDEAEQSEDVRQFIAENLYNKIENDKQFKLDIRIESDPEDVA
ncbi:hypothetical protein NSA29_11390 [Staphylococcus warneri]|uniref:hypothetical protein n=1 Tax=Staphylococcus warneri TaxID=1292 RepID=UPI00214B7FE3|nr:hypothetical protein [Staphylococcus warneri]MCR1798143.1 hypothetical protein [Staphylococcus warneri]